MTLCMIGTDRNKLRRLNRRRESLYFLEDLVRYFTLVNASSCLHFTCRQKSFKAEGDGLCLKIEPFCTLIIRDRVMMMADDDVVSMML